MPYALCALPFANFGGGVEILLRAILQLPRWKDWAAFFSMFLS
jgi:hypothetical protein